MAIDEKLERDLAVGQKGVVAELAAEMVGTVLSKRVQHIKRKVYERIDAGDLDPNAGLVAWAQMREIDALYDVLAVVQAKGQKAQERAAGRMQRADVGVLPAI